MTIAQAQPTDRAENEITEREKFYADLNRTRAEREKAEAEAKKLAMDTMKTELEIRRYTSVVSGSIALAWFSAGAAFVTGLVKLLSVWSK